MHFKYPPLKNLFIIHKNIIKNVQNLSIFIINLKIFIYDYNLLYFLRRIENTPPASGGRQEPDHQTTTVTHQRPSQQKPPPRKHRTKFPKIKS